MLSLYCKCALLRMYPWAVCEAFTGVEVINQAKFSTLDLQVVPFTRCDLSSQQQQQQQHHTDSIETLNLCDTSLALRLFPAEEFS